MTSYRAALVDALNTRGEPEESETDEQETKPDGDTDDERPVNQDGKRGDGIL